MSVFQVDFPTTHSNISNIADDYDINYGHFYGFNYQFITVKIYADKS